MWVCVFVCPLLAAGQAALPSGTDHQPAAQRLPDPGQDAQTDVRTTGVHPRHPAPQQEPHRRSALPQEETGLHPEPGGGDPQAGGTTRRHSAEASTFLFNNFCIIYLKHYHKILWNFDVIA